MKIPRQRSSRKPAAGLDWPYPLLMHLAFSIILIAYFMVWLPQPVAGLSLMGLEIGEWVKFVPSVRLGQVWPGRELFFIPPISLAFMLLVWTIPWPDRRWKTWIVRSLAVLVSLLAFPPIEVVRFEDRDQWLVRVLLILLVLVAAVTSRWWKSLLLANFPGLVFTTLIILGLIGAILPTWAYLAMREPISDLIGARIGLGPGIWANLFGNLLVCVVSGRLLRQSR